MTIINLINIFVLVLYAVTIAQFYNKRTEYFFALLIIIVYWTQLLVSSAYIETGVYLKDIGRKSYATGVTIRLFLMIELMLGLISYWAGKHPIQIATAPKEGIFQYRDFKGILWILFLMYAYRLTDILISGNILTNSGVTRFNYFSKFSKLPLANVVDYFSYPCLWILGYVMLLGEKKRQKLFPILIAVTNYLSLFLRGIEFGGYLQSTAYFLGPLLLSMARRRKLIKIRYVVIAAAALVVMLIPKYRHFSEAIMNGTADTSYGLKTAYDFVLYRALAQEADLTWEIDRQVWFDWNVDPGRFLETLKGILGLPVRTTDTQYLMNRACSSAALSVYSRGTAVVTGGYPVFWMALFGYAIGPFFLIIDAYFLFLVAKCICKGMEQQRLVLLVTGGYLLCQCYTIVLCANFSTIGNLIPQLLIIFLLFFYNRKLKISFGRYSIKM